MNEILEKMTGDFIFLICLKIRCLLLFQLMHLSRKRTTYFWWHNWNLKGKPRTAQENFQTNRFSYNKVVFEIPHTPELILFRIETFPLGNITGMEIATLFPQIPSHQKARIRTKYFLAAPRAEIVNSAMALFVYSRDKLSILSAGIINILL